VFYVELGKENNMRRALFQKFIGLLMVLTITFAGITSPLAASGSLDPTFGSGGIVTTDFEGHNDLGRDVGVQVDSKIVVVGTSFNGRNNDFALARYHMDGSLDTTFDRDGKATTDLANGYDVASAVALQLENKIIVAGSANNDSFRYTGLHHQQSFPRPLPPGASLGLGV
jgi:serralysin